LIGGLTWPTDRERVCNDLHDEEGRLRHSWKFERVVDNIEEDLSRMSHFASAIGICRVSRASPDSSSNNGAPGPICLHSKGVRRQTLVNLLNANYCGPRVEACSHWDLVSDSDRQPQRELTSFRWTISRSDSGKWVIGGIGKQLHCCRENLDDIHLLANSYHPVSPVTPTI